MERKIKILIVDDDIDDQEFVIDALSEIDLSFEHVTANDGYEALDILDSGETLPDYIFLDLNMPKMNGIQCLQAIKDNSDWKKIPVVICTTSSSEHHKKITEELGSFHFLTKPVRIATLAEELERVFEDVR